MPVKGAPYKYNVLEGGRLFFCPEFPDRLSAASVHFPSANAGTKLSTPFKTAPPRSHQADDLATYPSLNPPTMATEEPPVRSNLSNTFKGKGADFLTGSDMWTRWRNFYRMASGSMSPEGQKNYWHDADIRYEAVDCKRCESQRDWLLQYSPIIRFMSDNIKQLGGDLGKHNIRCRRCETGMQGGFDPTYGIKICANYTEGKSKMEDTMAHEMVHAYDHLRFKVNWDSKDLRHVACTEVCPG